MAAPQPTSVVLLSAPARALFAERTLPADYVGLLLAKELYEDALVFTAHVLPARAAVWWGCACAWKGVRPQPPGPEKSAFQACLHWIQKPDEETRRAAEQASAEAGLGTPAGCIALAAFCSKGNISQPGLPPVEATPDMTPRALVAGLRLAAALEDPVHLVRCYRRYVTMAREPLHHLSHASPKPKAIAESAEGSIASKWVDSGAATAAPPAPGSAGHAQAPAPPPDEHTAAAAKSHASPVAKELGQGTSKSTAKTSDDPEEKDAWEGLSNLDE